MVEMRKKINDMYKGKLLRIKCSENKHSSKLKVHWKNTKQKQSKHEYLQKLEVGSLFITLRIESRQKHMKLMKVYCYTSNGSWRKKKWSHQDYQDYHKVLLLVYHKCLFLIKYLNNYETDSNSVVSFISS